MHETRQRFCHGYCYRTEDAVQSFVQPFLRRARWQELLHHACRLCVVQHVIPVDIQPRPKLPQKKLGKSEPRLPQVIPGYDLRPRLCVGWGTLRVATGMAMAAQLYDRCQGYRAQGTLE